MHDQILGPIMGWARGYHGYVFEDPRDGAVIGPKKRAGYIDMMHASMMYPSYMDDRKCPLALILRDVGDICYYTYDLGDNWRHTLTVEQVYVLCCSTLLAFILYISSFILCRLFQ